MNANVIHSNFSGECFDADSSPAILPAGRYYIGDPCYVIPDEEWHSLLEHVNYFEGDGLFEYKGCKMAVYSTAWGDGLYPGYCSASNSFYSFGVDAGLLGAVPEELVSEEAKGRIDSKELWVVVEESGSLVCWKEGRGLIHLGPLSIETDECADEEEDEYF